MILKPLERLEKNPNAIFQWSEITDVDASLRDIVFRRVHCDTDLVRAGRLVTLVLGDNGSFEALDEDDPDYVEELSPDDVTRFRLNLEALADCIRSTSSLTGPSGPLVERLYLLGERPSGQAVVLALYPEARSAIANLKALPSLTSSTYTHFDVFCPTLTLPAAELRVLESLRVHASTMEPTDPFRLPLSRALDKEPEAADVSDDFEHSDGYTSVRIRSFRLTLNTTEAMVVECLDRARLRGMPDVAWHEIASRLPAMPRSMSDVFQRTPHWKELIASPRRGIYRLNLSGRGSRA